jgi:peptidyl-tRNA hydrolase, PTH1 family
MHVMKKSALATKESMPDTSTMSWIIVGLGNPGAEYEKTRHNAGRLAVMRFSEREGIEEWKEDRKTKLHIARGESGNDSVVLILPDTFMNKSGLAVAKYVKSPKAAKKLIVLYDDLDLPIGRMKISFDRGSGGHKGVDSIIRSVKTREFARIRIGISPETPSGKMKKPQGEWGVNDFILGGFKPNEIKELNLIFDRSVEAIKAIMERGVGVAMNQFNQN